MWTLFCVLANSPNCQLMNVTALLTWWALAFASSHAHKLETVFCRLSYVSPSYFPKLGISSELYMLLEHLALLTYSGLTSNRKDCLSHYKKRKHTGKNAKESYLTRELLRGIQQLEVYIDFTFLV